MTINLNSNKAVVQVLNQLKASNIILIIFVVVLALTNTALIINQHRPELFSQFL